MAKAAVHTRNGKAFEYALLEAFLETIQVTVPVAVINNEPYKTAKGYFESFDDAEKSLYRKNAKNAVDFLNDLESRLGNSLNEKEDILQLEIVSDREGQAGDVRDVLAIRSLQNWEIGISAKNNHRAVKHQRLSAALDFGNEWVREKCSNEYFEAAAPVFKYLEECKNRRLLWRDIPNKHANVYAPILQAFIEEINRLNKKDPDNFPGLLVKYLIGNRDFYKVIKRKDKVEIQAFNLYGTLGLPYKKIKSKHKVQKLKLPDELISIGFKRNSKTTVNLFFNEGWQFSFRIHSAESYVIPSLKFDVNLSSTPFSLFSNQRLLE